MMIKIVINKRLTSGFKEPTTHTSKNAYGHFKKLIFILFCSVMTVTFTGQVIIAHEITEHDKWKLESLIETAVYDETAFTSKTFIKLGNPEAQLLLKNFYGNVLGVKKNTILTLSKQHLGAPQDAVNAKKPFEILPALARKTKQQSKWFEYIFASAAVWNHKDFQVGSDKPIVNKLFWRPDSSKSLYLFIQSDGHGNKEDAYNLGIAFLYGNGGPKDIDAAINWLEISASEGFLQAQEALGYLYLGDADRNPNFEKSFHWFSLAASNGSSEALIIVGAHLWLGLTGKENKKLALEMFKRAYLRNDLLGQAYYGFALYELSNNSLKKQTEAVKLLKEAGRKGSGQAMAFLMRLHAKNSQVSVNKNLIFLESEPQNDFDKWWLVKTVADYYFRIGFYREAAVLRKLELNITQRLFGTGNEIYAKTLADSIRAVSRAEEIDGPTGNWSSLDLLSDELFDLMQGKADLQNDTLAFLYFVLAEAVHKSGGEADELLFKVLENMSAYNAENNFLKVLNEEEKIEIFIGSAAIMIENRQCEIALNILDEIRDIPNQEKFKFGFDTEFHLNIERFNALVCLERYASAVNIISETYEAVIAELWDSESHTILYNQIQNIYLDPIKERIFFLYQAYHLNERLWNIAFELSHYEMSTTLSKVYLSNFLGSVDQIRTGEHIKKLLSLNEILWTQSGFDHYEQYEDFLLAHLDKAKLFDSLVSLKGELTQNDMYKDVFARPATTAEIQEILKDDEGLVSIYFDQNTKKTFSFFVDSRGAVFSEISFGSANLAAAVLKLRSSLSIDLSSRDPFGLPEFDIGLSNALFKSIFGVVSDRWMVLKHIYYVPSGALESLPLSVLVSNVHRSGDTLDAPVRYQDVNWFANDFAVTRLPSVSGLISSKFHHPAEAESRFSFIGFGDPVLDGVSRGLRGLDIVDVYEGAKVNLDKLRLLPELPDTSEELNRIAAYLGAPSESVFLREQATEGAVKAASLRRSKVVAFATHGLISGELGGLEEPALVLTPPEKATEYDDGLLTASEVAQLDLNADIVLLSACNTGAGKELGASGLSGLARSFIYAGARSLLVTHWSVDSKATTKLTTGMFEAMALDPSIGRAEALRQSMLNMINDDENQHYAHPAFWAPFSLIGDGQTAN